MRFSFWMSGSDLETEPTEPGPLGKRGCMLTWGGAMIAVCFWAEMVFFFSVDCFRLQRGAVSLHQTLLCPQAVQAVPQQPLLLQVRRSRTSGSKQAAHLTRRCAAAQLVFVSVDLSRNRLNCHLNSQLKDPQWRLLLVIKESHIIGNESTLSTCSCVCFQQIGRMVIMHDSYEALGVGPWIPHLWHPGHACEKMGRDVEGPVTIPPVDHALR